jgi:hypothetical protein
MGVERWPVHRLVACATRPRRVPAAVAEAGLVTNEDLAGVSAGGDRGVHALASTVAPERGPRREEDTERNARRIKSILMASRTRRVAAHRGRTEVHA